MNDPMMFHRSVDVIEVSGADAESFLQGQVSQNVSRLEVGDSVFSLLLSPRGMVDSWFRVVRQTEDVFWCVIEHGFGQKALERLDRFRFRVDCELTLSESHLTLLRGSDDALDMVDRSWADNDGRAVLSTVWPSVSGLDFLGEVHYKPGGFTQGDSDQDNQRRILDGEPSLRSEFDEKTIPAAAGVVPMSVDFAKGCYVGQELVARIDSRTASTPTNLHQLRIDGVTGVVKDDLIHTDDGTAGRVTSSAVDGESTVALAYLKRGVGQSLLWYQAGEGRVPVLVQDSSASPA